jgi:hypothetical protein
MLIGRDLIRLLQNLSKIPEFELLWRDIINSPQSLSPQFAQMGGLMYILRTTTRKRCLISRLTPEMERKIYFLITGVKASNHKRYLDWFQKQYFSTPESQSLRVDIMRYITVVVHPTNEQLNSGLTPRWALCAWLINTCSSPIDFANLKLALFYDWLTYDAKKDNIMLIEPAILLMFNSIRTSANFANLTNINISLTTMLFDFLCKIVLNFHLPYREQILNGIMQSFKDCVDKKVIPSIQLFFIQQLDAKTQQIIPPAIDRELRNNLQATFGTFFQTLSLNQTPSAFNNNNSNNNPAPTSPLLSVPTNTTSSIPSPTPPSNLVTIGSEKSLFKQKPITEKPPQEEPSPTSVDIKFEIEPVTIQPVLNLEPEIEKLTQPVKNEPIAQLTVIPTIKTIKMDVSDDEDEEENASENIQSKNNNIINLKTPTPVPLLIPSPSPLINSIQIQLQQFTARPFKIYTTLEDSATITGSLSSNSLSVLNQNQNVQQNVNNLLENSLNLIHSDDLRDKLYELNDKYKDYYNFIINNLHTNNSASSLYLNPKLNFVNSLLKDSLNIVYSDIEYSAEYLHRSSFSDLAACYALIFRNDFTNNLLPNQFYTSLSNIIVSNTQNNGKIISNNNNDVDLISGALLNPNYIHLINESISQRPIFYFFKDLSNTTNQSNTREILIHLLNELNSKQSRIGYYFLYYIYSIVIKNKIMTYTPSNNSSSNNSKMSNTNELVNLINIYKEFMRERTCSNRSKNKNNNDKQSSSGDNFEKASSSSSSSSSFSSDEQEDALSAQMDDDQSDSEEKLHLTESEINLGKKKNTLKET